MVSPLCGCALPAVCLELVPESDDHIAPGDNVLVVGDVYDAGADPFGIGLDVGEDKPCRSIVQVCRDLVKHKQLGAAQKRTGQGKPLLHPPGELLRLLPEHERKRLHGILADHGSAMVIAYQADTAERIDQLLVADRPVKAVEKIFSDRAGNEKGDLRSVVECVAELFLGIAFLTAPEQSYLPLRMRIVSVQAADQAGFSATVRTLQGNNPVCGDRDAVIPGQGRILLGVGHDQVIHVDFAAAGCLAGGLNIEHGVAGAGGDLDQSLRLNDRGGRFVHETVYLVDGLDQLLEQQAHSDDRAGGHPPIGDEHDGGDEENDLEGDLAQLLEAVEGAHTAVVLFSVEQIRRMPGRSRFLS